MSPRRHAFLVGIDDYEGPPGNLLKGAVDRGWRNLDGAVNDVRLLREMLVARYGFTAREVATLTDRAATRAAILRGIETHLVRQAGPGDVVLFYFSGHGSQVRNSRSDEPDGRDETLVPADSRASAPDIRDKELRRLFNRILDRGARLTVVLDACYSGSAARGLPSGALSRGIDPDLRDAADPFGYGPRPEERGALVLSAAQDFDRAWESWDEKGMRHGAFSLAFVRAMRDAAPDEPAEETFLRTRARLQGELRFQEPVLTGNAAARLAPLLESRRAPRGDRAVVAVERVERSGKVILQGGWAHGLSVGSELRLGTPGNEEVRLLVTAMKGPGRCEAQVRTQRQRAAPARVSPGALAEVVSWEVPPMPPLRVWMPRAGDAALEAAVRLAAELAGESPRRRVGWVSDPTAATPTHLLRWREGAWELLGPRGLPERLGPAADAAAVLARAATPHAALFVQLPAPAGLPIRVGPGTDHEGIAQAERPELADYVLVGRLAGRRVEYAWVRPEVEAADRRRSGLPVRSDWVELDPRRADEATLALTWALLRLRRVQGWYRLESPAAGEFAYRLALGSRDGREMSGGTLRGGDKLNLGLRLRAAQPAVTPRYVYAFMIDSRGKSVLLFPAAGPLENRFPVSRPGSPSAAPQAIALGPPGLVEVTEPYGVDTYFLLSSEEQLPNPWVLEWEGVRTRDPRTLSPLEELVFATSGAMRSAAVRMPSSWSLERRVFESVPATARKRGGRDDA
ncbi:MAG TPA: caspase family protein [Thermoanaerobaculia bacterium]|nr:caspase family protein [Thermoanaerobaculia bacterium]